MNKKTGLGGSLNLQLLQTLKVQNHNQFKALFSLGMFAALGKTADMQHDMTFGTANLPQKNRGKRHFVKKDFQKCSST